MITVTATEIFVVFLFYVFGWMGALLLLITASYVFSTIYRRLHLENPANQTNDWRYFVARAYKWIDVDFYRESIPQTYLRFKLIILMAFIASMGILVIPVACILSIISMISISLWTNLS